MGEPMVQDGGLAGLEQSQHHPLANRSQYNAAASPDPFASQEKVIEQGEDLAEKLRCSILVYVEPDKQDDMLKLLSEIVARTRRVSIAPPTPPNDDEPVTIG